MLQLNIELKKRLWSFKDVNLQLGAPMLENILMCISQNTRACNYRHFKNNMAFESTSVGTKLTLAVGYFINAGVSIYC